MRIVTTIQDQTNGQSIVVTEQDDLSVTYTSGATIDGDGANGQAGGLPCYAPAGYQGGTLDKLGNAGTTGDWWGVVTDNGQANGNPILQKATDPRPGAYVSATALALLASDGSGLPDSSPFKYVDAATVPFISVPKAVVDGVGGTVVGCQATVTFNGNTVPAVVADTGSNDHIGEISYACAIALGIPVGPPPYPANGGGAAYPAVSYVVIPGKAAVVNGIQYPLQPSP
jgi:hypothetical protein